jgi:hypothetical protein
MTRWLPLVCLIAVHLGCSANRSTPPAEPFAGFWGDPASGAVELTPAGEGRYTGSLWADFGPFPVKLQRDGDVARGTVAYGGEDHPLELKWTPAGLVLICDGITAQAPLKPFKNQKAYEAYWMEHVAVPSYIVADDAPTTRPR